LSSGGGRDFGSFLGALAQLGYGFAYRVLDAQWFGVAQRRRRVFVVGYLGDWRPAAAVLFERQSLRRDTAPSREKGQVAPTIPSRSSAGGGLGTELDAASGLNPTCSQGGTAVMQPIAFTRCDYGNDAVVDGTPTMRCGSNYSAHLAIAQSMAVRRLTPVECERLQGFPDNYTEIPWRGKAETPDGPRYKALGNSMAVPVMRWIGQRIQGR
jgi:DNA (cytosine-5)-methyltransferase 1